MLFMNLMCRLALVGLAWAALALLYALLGRQALGVAALYDQAVKVVEGVYAQWRQAWAALGAVGGYGLLAAEAQASCLGAWWTQQGMSAQGGLHYTEAMAHLPAAAYVGFVAAYRRLHLHHKHGVIVHPAFPTDAPKLGTGPNAFEPDSTAAYLGCSLSKNKQPGLPQ